MNYCQEHHGRRGRGFHYSDSAIETALMLKAFFGLPLRALEGVINSIFQLMDVPLISPGYSSISKFTQTVNVKYRLSSKGAVTLLAVDARTNEIIAAEVSLEKVADNQVLLTLLNPLRRRLHQVSGYGAYDTREFHQLLLKKGSKTTILPRKNAGYWEEGIRETRRSRH